MHIDDYKNREFDAANIPVFFEFQKKIALIFIKTVTNKQVYELFLSSFFSFISVLTENEAKL